MTTVSLHPHLQSFIDEQIRLGRYASEQALIEDALERMMNADGEVAVISDPETIRSIETARCQIDAGKTIDAKEFAAEMRAKFQVPSR